MPMQFVGRMLSKKQEGFWNYNKFHKIYFRLGIIRTHPVSWAILARSLFSRIVN